MEENDTNKEKDDCEGESFQGRFTILEDRLHELQVGFNEFKVTMTSLLKPETESKTLIYRSIGFKRLKKKVTVISKKRTLGIETAAATKNYKT